MTTVAADRAATDGSFVHEGLLYADAQGYLAGTLPFIDEGLVADEPVMVAVPGPNLRLLRDALGTVARRVRMVDMAQAGRNPARIIPTVLLAFAAAHPDQHVRIIGEPIWAGRTAVEYPACAQHEALINPAFAGRDATVLCPYDTARLAPSVIDDAKRTHPVLGKGTRRWPSADYGDPFEVAAGFDQPLPPPPASAAVLAFRDGQLRVVREFVRDYATTAGVSDDDTDDLVVVVNELATNTLEHTDGDGVLSVWCEGDQLMCQVDDRGHLSDPLAGRIPPSILHARGRGLILVSQLTDLLRLHTRPGATSVRILKQLPPASATDGSGLAGSRDAPE